MSEQFRTSVRLLQEKPKPSHISRYSALLAQIERDVQPGWSLFVDADGRELMKLASAVRAAGRKRQMNLRTQVDLKANGLWIWRG